MDTLSAKGLLTIFGPTNEAFLELFDQLDSFHSLADFNTEEEIRLSGKILTYHFIDGYKITSSNLSNISKLIIF
ncbi:hypothetical protein DKG77_14590 [Flagellimonas aquimarina]|uniref:FAS1 domain-containing protein n=1 Tax=Flagellimonas aquimarina TaxID=2201895 RepID=A0A316KXJ9_9FLAO|nr:hypothetical protein DKG77_14590 [Allomuricauda koreensis]